ncbi:MAG: NAD(P)H-hydrate dehydratase [bacterium]
MLLLAGTIPRHKGSIISGSVEYHEGSIKVGDMELPVGRGTAALAGAAAFMCAILDINSPVALLCGDIGQKSTSSNIYHALQDFLKKNDVKVLTLHYMMPNIFYHKKLIEIITAREPRPFLIADAGSMYVAKAAGQARIYDLFTPDVGEMAFLADDKADHPAYTRGFICHLEGEVPALIERAYRYHNTAKYLCVKGSVDYICCEGSILERVSEPSVEALEAIGGTGDTLTGIVSALVYKGMSFNEACLYAAKINRWAGKLAHPTPATQISTIIEHLPEAFGEVIK